MPDDNNNLNLPIPQTFPEDVSIPPIPSEMGQTITGTPTVIPSDKPNLPAGKAGKKFGNRTIATILGLFVLVGGVSAGVFLVKQQQDIREKASAPIPCKTCTQGTCVTDATPPNCSPVLNECSNNADCPQSIPTPPTCGEGLYCRGGVIPGTIPSGSSPCTSRAGLTYCCPQGQIISDDNGSCILPTTTTTCTLTGSEICVGNVQTGDCYQGGTNNEYACYKLVGNPGKEISGSKDCACPTPYTWGPRSEMNKDWCFNTAIRCDGQYPYAERCSLQPKQCAGATPTPVPTGGGPTAQCFNIKAYDANWNLLTSAQLSALKAGDKVRFTVAGSATGGSFDKAKFTINSVAGPEVTAKKPSS
ncbi:MAG: hypothetical protein U1C56_01975, partial [Candidatus Curtissbacteria bacterium]|nr:hypothetical protein [Candidatus Curtissbacteria bacterium]